jgi:hypothetical protein
MQTLKRRHRDRCSYALGRSRYSEAPSLNQCGQLIARDDLNGPGGGSRNSLPLAAQLRTTGLSEVRVYLTSPTLGWHREAR